MSGSGSGGARVSLAIPSNVKKTIQNIKEIMGNHSEDEIYAMLKECSMDPNETAQKLLLLDTFHEVKRKRDKKKENANNKESGDSRWKSGPQGRGSRGGRTSFSSRSHDATGGRNSVAGRGSGTNQAAEKAVATSLTTFQEKKELIPSASSVAVVANGPNIAVSGNASAMSVVNLPAGGDAKQCEVINSSLGCGKLGSEVPLIDAEKTTVVIPGSVDAHVEANPCSSNSSVPVTPALPSTVCLSTWDPVLLPSHDSRVPGTVGTIKREVGSHRTVGESNAVSSAEKYAPETGTSFLQLKVPSKSQGIGKSHDSSQPLSSSRPSSNYGSRPQQIIGLQKVGGNKEWKPKPTNSNLPQGSGTSGSSESHVEANVQSQPLSDVNDSEEATSKLQKKLEEVHLSPRQHVIIPTHILVPESERTKLSFGSFDASFGITLSHASGQESEKSSTLLSETLQVEESVEEQAASNQNAVATSEEVVYQDHSQSPTPASGNLSGEGDVLSSAVSDYNESKQEAALLSIGHQYSTGSGHQNSTVHTSPSYSFGFMPPMIGGQVAALENSDSQARDMSRLTSFVVQQPFDPASYYAQYYHSGADSDGRVSPFPSHGVAAKYDGNVTGLPQHSSQSPQEGGNPLVMTSAGSTPLVTQAAGLLQNSISMTQQPLPVFRPTGLHISHYPPNYIPYGHYYSPFFVPPLGMHQFLSNGAFPQQPQAGGLYPAPPAAAAATGVKYSFPQYKPGTNTGNPTHVAIPSGYAPYGSAPGSYNPSSTSAGGNTTTNEDLGSTQFKESSVYITGQQSEGSAVWIAAPGRDLSSLPVSSFYNIPPQGQHMAFAPAQAGHGSFGNIYHPAQAVTATAHPLLQQSQTMGGAVDIVGPTSSVYQQQQHQQINWPSNY